MWNCPGWAMLLRRGRPMTLTFFGSLVFFFACIVLGIPLTFLAALAYERRRRRKG